MRRVFLLRLVGVVIALTTFVALTSECMASRYHCGYRGYSRVGFAHRYVHPRSSFHFGRSYYGAYPRHSFASYRSCYRPSYYRSGCGWNYGLGVARHYVNRYVGGCYPIRRPCYYPRYYPRAPRYYGCGWASSGWASPYRVDYIPSLNYVNYRLPPVYYPAELAYGPQAVKQFMGVDRNFAMGPLTYTVYDAAKDAARAVDLKPATSATDAPDARVSNARTLELARRYVDFGDGRFRDQKYHDALQRYKTAIAIAPDLADSHIRHGLASVATGRYEAAVESIARGLQLDPNWPARGFALSDVYADSRAAKTGHIEALARTALAKKDDGNSLYLLGVLLYLDGHKDRSQKFLQRAAELFGNDKATRPFTGAAAPAAVAVAL